MAVSLSQVLNPVASFQTALSLTGQSGYLSDPYKLQDSRPDEKTQIAFSNSLRYFFIRQMVRCRATIATTATILAFVPTP